MKRLRWVWYALFLALCLAIGFAGRLASNTLSSFGGVGAVWAGIANPRGQFPGKSRLTVLLIGEDYSRNRYGKVEAIRSRSDTIMMLSVDLDRKTVRACSIPRDTRVDAPDGVTGKINGTFARGGEDLLERTLEGLFNVQIDNYVVIKPDAVRTIVDAVGGVDVEAIDDMKYHDNWGGLDIDIPKGDSHLDGKRAEGYVRFREVNRYRIDNDGSMIPLRGVKGSLEEGDIRRTARQQQLIQALVSSALKPSNIVRAPQIVETGFGEIETNLTRTQALALATIMKGETANMLSGTVPGSDSTRGGVYYYVLDEERARAMVDWLINGNDAAMRDVVRVAVKNGGAPRGATRAARDRVREVGYRVQLAGSSDEVPATTVLFSKAAFRPAAEEIARLIGASSVAKNPRPPRDWDPEITVLVGKDSKA